MNQPTSVTKITLMLVSEPVTLLVPDDFNLLYISLNEIARHLNIRLSKVRSPIAEPMIQKLTCNGCNGTKEVVEAILFDLYLPLLARYSIKGVQAATVLCEHFLCGAVNDLYAQLRDKKPIVDFIHDSKPGESYPFGSDLELKRIV